MKLLYYHNYDMRQQWRKWKERLDSDLHLFGTNYLADQGIQVDILRHKWGFLRENGRYGNINQQARVAGKACLYSIIYAGYFFDTRFLGLLHKKHLFRADLISVLHSPIERTEQHWNTINANWKIPVISQTLYTEIIATWPEFKDKFVYMPVGADLGFYPKPSCEPKPDGYILSIGATRRDFKTLVEAAKKSDRRFIICTHQESGLTRSELPSNVTLHEKSFMGYSEAFKLYKDCLAVAIPLDLPPDYRGTQIGNTSLLEAMAMGKPALMTRHPLNEINIEEHRIGYFARSKDVNSWSEAINKISGNTNQSAAMGQRGRLLCEEKYNMVRYGKDLYQLLTQHPKFAH
jgi:glycosyltransferase involved in cell wall biosynthesis